MDHFHRQIWAYLHNELPPEKRAQFERAAEQDSSLQEEIAVCRAVHHDLEDWGNQLLEKELLAEWESEHPEYQENIRRRNRVFRRLIPVAAAAALVLGWPLQISLQELKDGYLVAAVSGHPERNPASEVVWEESSVLFPEWNSALELHSTTYLWLKMLLR
ncbi:MAG: hypothetical protein JXR23_07215 [Pontiellaceae bacterium]|nr:hypothetical protein [Pontiellaceae bacterium]